MLLHSIINHSTNTHPSQLIDNYNLALSKRPVANINLSPMTPLFASSTTSNHLSSKLVKSPSDSLTIKLLDQQVLEDQRHPLRYTWVFWFMHRPPGAKITNYESGMKKIASVSSVSQVCLLSTGRKKHSIGLNRQLPYNR